MRTIVSLMLMPAIMFAKADAQKSGAPPPPPPAPTGKFEITTAVTMPEIKRAGGRGGESLYPFADLPAPNTVTENGQSKTVMASFHLAGRTAKNMASTVSSANKRFNKQATNDDGSPKFEDKPGPNNTTVRSPVMAENAKFKAFNVGADDPKGEGVRIFRIK